jgi:hypothetical protein
MRKRLAFIAVALGFGVTSARANPDPTPPTDIGGSDTMREITIDVINQCALGGPAGSLASSLIYIGGGSTAGGTRMNPANSPPNALQQVAPQSRFLNATECSYCKNPASEGICTATGTAVNRGQGVQIGLDGIAVFHDNTEFTACRTLRYAGCMEVKDLNHAGPVDRNGDGDTTDSGESGLGYGNGAAGIDDGTGAGATSTLSLSDGPDADGVLDHYCFTHWADALRIIYNGQHAHLDDSTAAKACRTTIPSAEVAAIGTKRCNSDVRRTLVETWSNMFDYNEDDGAGGCDDAFCTRLRHAFRRDDFSGTTDTFLSLIGVPGVGTAFNVRTFCNGLENEDMDPIRRPCTTASNPALDPVSVCAPILFANRNAPFGMDGSPSGAAGSVAPTPPSSSAVSDLGLVLPVSLPTELDSQYDATFCTNAPAGGSFRFAQAPNALSTAAQRCPDGNPRNGGQCRAPVGAPGTARAGLFNCLVRRSNRPGGSGWPNFDARAYNMVPRDAATGAILQLNSNSVTDPRWGGGGHYRIHISLPELPQTAAVFSTAHPNCRLPDATRQIGCLVQADACSIGFAGLEAEDQDVIQEEIDVLGTNLPYALRVPFDSNTSETVPMDTAPADIELEPRVTTIQRLVEATGAACEGGTGNYDIRYPLARVLWLNASKGFGAFPGTLPNITNLVDSEPANGTADLATRENDFARCYTDRNLVDPILESHGYIALPPTSVYPEVSRLKSCP